MQPIQPAADHIDSPVITSADLSRRSPAASSYNLELTMGSNGRDFKTSFSMCLFALNIHLLQGKCLVFFVLSKCMMTADNIYLDQDCCLFSQLLLGLNDYHSMSSIYRHKCL